ncbi:polyphosphate kinase 1 [Thermogutta sp.]|uniref:polyphosphate kinase 1 n=1 Tax=Thermogutta sp. TaxID=1962930 RepID=UPI003C79EF14
MKKKSFSDPSLYINRELSWLEFNERVLQEGLSPDVPLLERLKFLAIVSSNLDEFYMIRVASLMQLQKAGKSRRDISGMTPEEQLRAIAERVRRMVKDHDRGILNAFEELAQHGIQWLRPSQWSEEDRLFLRQYFEREIAPVLTPLAMSDLSPPPAIPGLQIHLGVVLRSRKQGSEEEKIAFVPIPTRHPRFVFLPAVQGHRLALLDDVVASFVQNLFRGYQVVYAGPFRVTRDADVSIQDDDASDLLSAVEEAILARRRRAAVRLEVATGIHRRLYQYLLDLFELTEADVVAVDSLVSAASLREIVGLPGYAHLRDPDWPPQPPRDLLGWDDLWKAILDHDVMLFHPYESFEPVVTFLREAANDPDVLAIKQTLYRTSGESPVVEALETAGRKGKEVTVIVEVKARFDEARNVQWARRLEDAGCHVIYGVAGYKTHAKALLVVRREQGRIRRYVHLSTGNYNDQTARIYSDIGLFTADPDITTDVASFFNLLTGYSEAVGWNKLTVEPGQLKAKFISLIEREIEAATADYPGLILAKINSLQDRDICAALYKASQAGVKIKLNVRGICCLRPGIPGISDNIEVRSIVDRFLEHARIFYFSNGGREEVYLASADWMERNLERRVEIIFPVQDPVLQQRLIEILNIYFSDNVKAWHLCSDGTYRRVASGHPRVRAQEYFYQKAVEAAQMSLPKDIRYRPLHREQASD